MGTGIPELVIILFVVLLVFGASKLPAAGAGPGRGTRNFKNAVSASDEADVDQESPSVA